MTVLTDAEQAVYVLDALDTGEWRLLRCLPDKDFTVEYERAHRWVVQRQIRPFCDLGNCSYWYGSTAFEAIKNSEKSIEPAKEQQRLRDESRIYRD